MDEIIRFIQKEKHKKFLEIFMILDQIMKKSDIISFDYNDNLLQVKTNSNDLYKIKIIEEEKRSENE